MLGLRKLTCKAEALLALPMSVVEFQAKELRVNVAEDGGQGRDIASVGMLIRYADIY